MSSGWYLSSQSGMPHMEEHPPPEGRQLQLEQWWKWWLCGAGKAWLYCWSGEMGFSFPWGHAWGERLSSWRRLLHRKETNLCALSWLLYCCWLGMGLCLARSSAQRVLVVTVEEHGYWSTHVMAGCGIDNGQYRFRHHGSITDQIAVQRVENQLIVHDKVSKLLTKLNNSRVSKQNGCEDCGKLERKGFRHVYMCTTMWLNTGNWINEREMDVVLILNRSYNYFNFIYKAIIKYNYNFSLRAWLCLSLLACEWADLGARLLIMIVIMVVGVTWGQVWVLLALSREARCEHFVQSPGKR